MEGKTITIDNRTFKEKFDDAVQNAKAKVKEGINWCVENKEFVLAAIPAAVVTVDKVTKTVNRIASNEATRAAERMKKLHYYDRKNDTYLNLKKPMTNAQKVEFDRRKAKGESATQILSSMGLLRR